MDKTLVTVNEFAKKLEVTPQAIYKHLEGKLKDYLEVVDGQKMLKTSAFVEVYGKDINEVFKTKVETIEQQNEVLFLREMVKKLESELSLEREKNREVQDKLLSTLDTIANSQVALATSQAANKVIEMNESNSSNKKKGIFSMFKNESQ